MQLRHFILLLLMLLPLTLQAQIYKWIDEQGNINYSQTPPARDQGADQVIKMEKSGALLKIEATKSGHDYYCGDLLLLSDWEGDDILQNDIKLNLKDWEQARNAQEDKIKALKVPNQKWDNKAVKQAEDKLAKFNCRIRWSHQMLKHLTSFTYQAQKTNKALSAEIAELKRKQDKECPADGKRYGGMLVGEAAQTWWDCHQGYERRMKELRRKVKENKKAIREVKANE